ncbi:MAG: elongation factor G [Fibrobacteria bacterium]|nr:elongation factor G [Fibrobacteria bacterium]
MKEYKTGDIRNISIIGGAQTGKTTLGEAILFNSGTVSRQGSVDDGSSVLDFLPDEVDKKISISSSLFNYETRNTKINFIDTPGYVAFVSNVTAAINTCESSLIVVDGESGMDVSVKKSWRKAAAAGQSRFLFVNKLEKERVEYDSILQGLQEGLSPKVFPVTIPIGACENFSGVVDLIKQKAYVQKGNKIEETDIPADMKEEAELLRATMMENAAENSEELLDKYLENGTLSDEELLQGLKMGINSGDSYPVFAGSARSNIGVKRMVENLALLAPNPIEKEVGFTCVTNSGEEIVKKIDESEPTLAHIFKIIDDPKVGEYFFFKVYQGTVFPAHELIDVNSGQKERIGHIFAFSGKNRVELGPLCAGDIGATAKLKTVGIGHTLFLGKDGIKVKDIDFPNPVVSEAVVAGSEKDSEKIVEGILSINRIDPCFVTEHRAEFNERIITGISRLHIDTMIDRLRKRLGVEINLVKPLIPYRETIRKQVKAQGKYKKQTGGHGQYGDCQIELIPKPMGAGYSFVDNISGGVIPGKYIPAVDKGVQEAMTRGVVAGFPMVDLEVSLFYGSYHNVDSSDLAFQMAGRMAFRKAAEDANPVLLEPIMNVKVTIPDSSVGDISADFNQRRGKILGMDPLGDGYTCISAHVPQGEMYNYSVDLDSMTKGDGEYEETLEKYEPIPSSISERVIKEIAREHEE